MNVETIGACDKISKVFNAMNYDAVGVKDIDSKHVTLSTTFLIFNQYSIQKMFWKTRTKEFSTIPLIVMDVESVNGQFLTNSMLCTLTQLKQTKRHIIRCGSSQNILYTL